MNINLNTDDNVGWCDFCSQRQNPSESRIVYLCNKSRSTVSVPDTHKTRVYCQNCGPRSLEYPCSGYNETLLLAKNHSVLENSKVRVNPELFSLLFGDWSEYRDLDFQYKTLDIYTSKGISCLDISPIDHGLNWDLEALQTLLMNSSPTGPRSSLTMKQTYSPMGIIDFLDITGFPIDNLVDNENSRIDLSEDQKESIKYFMKCRSRNEFYFMSKSGVYKRMANKTL